MSRSSFQHQGSSQDGGQDSRRSQGPRPAPRRIPQSFIDNVMDRADILEVVSASVQLKKSGANYLGLCPFHSEKSPSFTVAPSKGFFHCFGCGVSGFALDFLMQHHGLPFKEALKDLAQSCGIALPPEMLPPPPSGNSGDAGQDGDSEVEIPADTGSIYAANERAMKFYRQALGHETIGQAARHYLKSERAIQSKTANAYSLGFAPEQWRSLDAAFEDYDNNPFLPQAGLVREKISNQGRTSRYDWFRGRIIFPVRDIRGKVVAFGGRHLPMPAASSAQAPASPEAKSQTSTTEDKPSSDGPAKYMNSPDTPVFVKSHVLYGLYEARQAIREKKFAIVVEGYMDVVMLAQGGFGNAVAGMGTAFTRQQFERLALLTDKIIFAFDGDTAGQAAAWRLLNTVLPLVEDRLDIRFCLLDEAKHGAKDPDEIIRKAGPQAFEAILNGSSNLSEFLITQLRERHHMLERAEDRARFAAEASNLVNRLPFQGQLRRILRQQVAQESQIPGSSLAAISASSRHAQSQSPAQSFWSKVLVAIDLQPQAALAIKDDLIGALDEESPEEMQVLQALQELQASAGSGAANDGNASASQSTPEALQARDLIDHLFDSIVELRREQIIQDMQQAKDRGEMDELTFLRESMRIRAGG